MSTYVFNFICIFWYPNNGGTAMHQPALDPALVGSVLAEYRKSKGISQEVLSGLADIGRTHLSAIERGERKPTLEPFYRICQAMDIPMSRVISTIEERMKQNNHRLGS